MVFVGIVVLDGIVVFSIVELVSVVFVGMVVFTGIVVFPWAFTCWTVGDRNSRSIRVYGTILRFILLH